jgi:glycosyltransferase involved in cell wall biosynthesis
MWAYSGNRLRPLLDRFVVARLSDAFVAVSEEGRRQMIEIEHVRERDIVLIPNGVPELPAGDGALIRKELGIPAGSRLIGSVGHLRTEKAFEVLVAALPKLADAGTHLLIAGEGPERQGLEALASELGVAERVHLPGARADVPDILDALDAAICCSDFEGGPLSVMEYMAAGLPVVASDVGGLPELIHDGETGLLVPPRDPEALAAALDRIATDQDLAGRLGRAARELRARRYDIDVWAGRIGGLYDDLLKLASERRLRRFRT